MIKNLSIGLLAIFILFGEAVYSQNITAITMNNLDFGDVYIGYARTVNHTDAEAAKFRMRQTVSGNPLISVTFVLPSSLVLGAYNIPVIFGTSTTAYSLTDSPAGRTNFNPLSPLNIRLQRNDFLYVWLGGIINVPTNVISGIYLSTITVTIAIL